MEIITGVERRRRWRPEQKLRILAELDEPDVTVADVARRHELSRGLLWQWRDAQRRGELAAEEPGFVALRVLPGPEAPPAPPPADAAAGTDGRIEIVLPDGTALRVSETVGAGALHRVLAALRR
jgi:transposase